MLANQFDMVISLGEDCACAMYLKKCLLRDASYPFDWLCHALFEKRIELLLNQFDGFLQKENMRQLIKPTTGLRDLENDSYEDVNNGFYFYHDFKANLPFEVAFGGVKEKYNRRIRRLYENVAKHEKVLFVWWSRDKKIDADDLLKAQRRLSECFKKNIYLLVFENDAISLPREENISEFVVKHTANLMGNLKTTTGDEKVSLAVFRRIKKKGLLGLRFKIFIKRRFVQLLTMFVPIKSLRKRIRQKLK